MSNTFSTEERAAMKDRAQELKAAARSDKGKAAGEKAVIAKIAKIAKMPEPDRAIGERLHALITASAPTLSPQLWYGSPAYAKDGKVVCFFQSAQKYKTRYTTLGFSDSANLDEGSAWPAAYAITTLTADDEAKFGALVKQSAS